MPRPNEQIGPYTLVRQLGRGAFGTVWLAERRGALATTKVAIKLIMDDDPDLDAIGQESQVWAQVAGHPNVLSIIEADMYDGQVVIVSEYAPDGSLEGWLKRNGGRAPSLESATSMTTGILAGLEHLHSKQIIHRDLKPANILLQGETPRLADFGLARVIKSSANSGGIAGTPAYMSPEAFDGKRSEQSDIWSAGVIFYQLLAGRTPYPQTDLTALIGAIVQRDPDPLPASIPAPLQEVVFRALQKESSSRYQSAVEMRAALQSASLRSTNSLAVGIITQPDIEQRATVPALGQASMIASTQVKVDTEASTKEIPQTNTAPGSGQKTLQDTLPQAAALNQLETPRPVNWKVYAGSAVVLILLSMSLTLYITGKREQTPAVVPQTIAPQPQNQPTPEPAKVIVEPTSEEPSPDPNLTDETDEENPEANKSAVKVTKKPQAEDKTKDKGSEITDIKIEAAVPPPPPGGYGLSPEDKQKLRRMQRMLQQQRELQRRETQRQIDRAMEDANRRRMERRYQRNQ
jgi:serine/threonine protein kinase